MRARCETSAGSERWKKIARRLRSSERLRLNGAVEERGRDFIRFLIEASS